MSLIIGTAGWSIARQHSDAFPGEGTALQRYAAHFPGVEINSSFHRPHRRETWQRWADNVPAEFRFAAKLPKTITHERRLIDCAEPLARFLDESAGLGGKLAVLLVQLPPRLAFDAAAAETFLFDLASKSSAAIACEPRHPSWFEAEADTLLDRLKIARVAADPACVPAAALPGGWHGLAYLRLHGSPRMYRSSYDSAALDHYAELIRRQPGNDVWCMFDNTASSAATGNALDLAARLEPVGDAAL